MKVVLKCCFQINYLIVKIICCVDLGCNIYFIFVFSIISTMSCTPLLKFHYHINGWQCLWAPTLTLTFRPHIRDDLWVLLWKLWTNILSLSCPVCDKHYRAGCNSCHIRSWSRSRAYLRRLLFKTLLKNLWRVGGVPAELVSLHCFIETSSRY